jgi:AraC-like DNA-binding protein
MPHWSVSRPAGSVQLMLGLAAEHGVPLATCVDGTGLAGPALTDPTCEIAGKQELAVLRNILRALDPRVPFALLAGQRYRTTTHGAWGFAVMTSDNIRDALEVGTRYFDLTYSFNRFGYEIAGHQVRLVYDDSDNPDDLRAALVERDMAAALALELDLLGRRTVAFEVIQLRGPRPAYAAAFEPLFGVTPQWNAEVNCIALDVSMLDIAGRLADHFGHDVSEELCRALLERQRARSGIAGRVRGRLLHKAGEFPNMQAVAAELGMSTRTLRNRLRREATSYRALVEEIREALAEELLAAGEMTIDQIAQRLGYADTSSFIAAFKRWKGVAPGGYREKRGE